MNNKQAGLEIGVAVIDGETGMRGKIVREVAYKLPGKWYDVLCADGVTRMYCAERLGR